MKKNTNDGAYNYIKICEIYNQGFIVRAATFIERHTLICEYIGDIFTHREFCQLIIDKDKNVDSNMDLIITPISETSLIICPYNHSNIARFISGINNSVPNFKKLTNVFQQEYR